MQILWASKRLISSMDELAAGVESAKLASSQELLNYIIYFIVNIAVLCVCVCVCVCVVCVCVSVCVL